MVNWKTALVCGLLLLTGWGGEAASLQAYLRLDGVEGGVTERGHKDWIEVLSVTNRVAKPGAGGTGVGVGNVTFGDFILRKPLDKSSPKLAQLCAGGEVLASARLELLSAGAVSSCFYEVVLDRVTVTGVERFLRGGGQDSGLEEVIALSFEGIRWTYTYAESSGQNWASAWAEWDLVRNLGAEGTEPGGPITLRRAYARLKDAQTVELTWEGEAGFSYDIIGGPTVLGPWAVMATVRATTTGLQTNLAAISPGAKFFVVNRQ